MSELDEFLETVVPQQRIAEKAMHEGDATLRLAMWTERDPATLLGAALPCVSGAADVRRAFPKVAARFTDCSSYEFEVVAVVLPVCPAGDRVGEGDRVAVLVQHGAPAVHLFGWPWTAWNQPRAIGPLV